MRFRLPRSMLTGQLKTQYKTSVKRTIRDLGHSLLTHHGAPRMHKPHECHLEGSWKHLGASSEPPASYLGLLWELPAASWKPSGLA